MSSDEYSAWVQSQIEFFREMYRAEWGGPVGPNDVYWCDVMAEVVIHIPHGQGVSAYVARTARLMGDVSIDWFDGLMVLSVHPYDAEPGGDDGPA